jgi:hypothetical protein
MDNNALLNHKPDLCVKANNLKKFVFSLSFGAKNFCIIIFSKLHSLSIFMVNQSNKRYNVV